MFKICPHVTRSYYRVELTSRLAFSSNIKNTKQVKPFNRIPGPTRLPILGNLYLYKLGRFKVSKYHKVLERLHEEYGPVVRQDIGQNTIIHVFHPDDIKTVYSNEDAMPHVMPLQETTQIYRKQSQMSPGLGNVNGVEWLRLRSAVRQMMLRPKEVASYLHQVEEVALDATQRLEQAQARDGFVSDLRSHIAKWALESSGMVCFETRLGCMSGGPMEKESEQMIEANQAIFQISGFLKFALPIYRYIPTPKWKRLVEAEDFFYKGTNKWVKQTMEKTMAQTSKDGDAKYKFMSYLLSRKELSEKDATIITFSLFADGLSTTVPAMLFNLYCLACNPEVQEKAFQEIEAAMDGKKTLSVSCLSKLTYLKAVVKETFRMYPVGTEVSRITRQPMVLSEFDIPAGTHVNLTPNVHFRSEEFFEQPEAFLPERWLRDYENTIEIHPFLLTPFGFGTRTCAGRRFAEQDLYVLLVHIIRTFRLKLDPSEKIEPLEQIYNTLLFPNDPIKLQFSPRNTSI